MEKIEWWKLYTEWGSIVINLLIAIVSGIFALMSWWKKTQLEKEVERYKYELKSAYLKNEIKTTQLFVIYPE